MGAVASVFGVAVAIALGGVLTLAIGLGAYAWGRRGAFDAAPSSATSGGMLAGTARPR